MDAVLEILGGPAGQTRYIPSVETFDEHRRKTERDQAVRRRFEMILREESQDGGDFTMRAYEAIATETGLGVRQVQRIVSRRG